VFNHTVDAAVDYPRIPPSTLIPFESYVPKGFLSEETDFLDAVPVMPATVFGLDVLLQEPNIDLQMVSDLVLADVGATIQTLRLAGREYENVAERPSRMCECIAGLDAAMWFEAISARVFVGDREHSATTAIWKHCRSVAQCARFVAESMDNITPDDAYLVGLLHGIGAIPAALNWPESELWRAMSAMEETLPPFVLEAMRSADDPSCSSVWRFVLTAAHKLAGAQIDFHVPVPNEMRFMEMSAQ
jgi:hypothetical protein